MDKYTLCQHSGWVVSRNGKFQRGVEIAHLNTESEVSKVREVGGTVYDTYPEVSEAESRENYPPEVKGLIPNCKGSFSNFKIRGLPIYIPKVETLEEVTSVTIEKEAVKGSKVKVGKRKKKKGDDAE